MSVSLRRLRWTEWLATAGALVLLTCLFAIGETERAPLHGGWHVLGWLLLVTVAVVITAVLAQALARGPALSASLDVVGLVLASVTTLLLIVRLATTRATLRAGAFVELATALAIFAGMFMSLRTEQGWCPSPDRPIEVVPLPDE